MQNIISDIRSMNIQEDEKYNFRTFFDKTRGIYVRSGIYENGVETDVNLLLRERKYPLQSGIQRKKISWPRNMV